jgi:hypothetical protein
VIRVAYEIEPVPRPSFTERPGSEQAVHDALVSKRGIVADERSNLLRRGRQTGEVERHPSQPRVPVSLRDGPQLIRFQLRQHELVNRPARPL